jgi:hypothetical protein
MICVSNAALSRLQIGALVALCFTWTVAPAAESSQGINRRPQKKSDPALEELHRIGTRIADAVLAKDIPSLLTYGRRDMRSDDEIALKNSKSDLYCYLFSAGCISWGKGQPSVFDIMSRAHELAIKAVDLGKSKYNGQRYAVLFFYDGTKVSEKMLHSSDFLCKEGPQRIASWKFTMNNGKWEPVTPFFDFGTDSLCPPE